ncbi:MAG: two pore domain potassium channel family protein, partial [Acidobacteria bacterium]
MRVASLLIGLILIATALWDAFETVVLPRTVTRRLRLARTYFRFTWQSWSAVATRVRHDSRRERFLAVYGPVSLLGLLTVWAL